jgi:catechol 2,3-dioxygenase-like lactoylglutathione lyase family enzyme
MELGHFEVSLRVTDVRRAVEFYRELGFEHAGGDLARGWATMRRGTVQVGLYEGIESNLLTFIGGDVFANARELERRGLVLRTAAGIEPDGSAGATVADPDGNVIYLNTLPDEAAGNRSE